MPRLVAFAALATFEEAAVAVARMTRVPVTILRSFMVVVITMIVFVPVLLYCLGVNDS